MAVMPAAQRSIGTLYGIEGRDPQAPSDVAIVMCSVLRPSLLRAVESVFRQDLRGTLQLLIGVDRAQGPLEPLLALLRRRPAHVGALLLDPGYSTSRRHGGLHHAPDGGATRTLLSYLANSRLLAYLDDDNWWLPNHLSSLAAAVRGFDWAYSLRAFVDARSGKVLCVDHWDSAGPGRGLHRRSLGGLVDVNCLMIDKTRAEDVLGQWALRMPGWRAAADRRVFLHLRTRHPVAWTGLATVRYTIRPTFHLWPRIRRHLARGAAAG